MHQPVMLSTAFLMVLLFVMLSGILPASAFPVSQPGSDISAQIIGAIQRRGPFPTPTILLPRDQESAPPAQPSSSNTTSSTTEANEGPHSGLDPNVTTAIVIGATFGTLFLVAAFMYAFRVGWEKGQQLRGSADVDDEVASLGKPPVPQILELWHIDVTKPPKAVDTGKSCWDSGSWTYCEERTEQYQSIGERYSFRPGKGVYEIGVSKKEEFPEFWSMGKAFDGFVLEDPRDIKGKGRETPVNMF